MYYDSIRCVEMVSVERVCCEMHMCAEWVCVLIRCVISGSIT